MSNGFHNLDAHTQSAMYDSMYDEQEKQEIKRRELIEKFANGWERYSKEPLFRNIVEALTRGAEPFDIIEKLIDMNMEMSENIRQFLNLHAFPSKVEIKK